VREFLAALSNNLIPHRDMEQPIGAKLVSQIVDKVPLHAGDLGGCPMADECDLPIGICEFFDSSGERIHAPRKQDDPVRAESGTF